MQSATFEKENAFTSSIDENFVRLFDANGISLSPFHASLISRHVECRTITIPDTKACKCLQK
jgi:hypothetical protein